MSDAAGQQMSVDEFLAWADGREGKWELHDGRVVAMAPEMAVHARIKAYAVAALIAALRRKGGDCGVYADGLAVRTTHRRAFIPDVLVTCPPTPDRTMETTTPLIVVEVLSPSTAAFDHGAKLEGYFSLESLAHYLLIDPERRVVIQHSRGREGVIETRILRDGELKLDPPGLAFAFGELFGD
jgi:Uma2 family endonuclease